MNATEFINKCDLSGGLSNLFGKGITPYKLESSVPLAFRCNLYEAYVNWKRFKQCEDVYYTMCEEGEIQ